MSRRLPWASMTRCHRSTARAKGWHCGGLALEPALDSGLGGRRLFGSGDDLAASKADTGTRTICASGSSGSSGVKSSGLIGGVAVTEAIRRQAPVVADPARGDQTVGNGAWMGARCWSGPIGASSAPCKIQVPEGSDRRCEIARAGMLPGVGRRSRSDGLDCSETCSGSASGVIVTTTPG